MAGRSGTASAHYTQFGSTKDDRPEVIALHATGIYVAGSTLGELHGPNLGDDDAFLRKMSRDGKAVLWSTQFGTAAKDTIRGMAVDDTGVFVVGITAGALDIAPSKFTGSEDCFVHKYGHDGALLWKRQFYTDKKDEALAIAVDASGLYVVGATIGSFAGESKLGKEDAYVMKLDREGGTMVWVHHFGTGFFEECTGIVVRGGVLYVSGATGGQLEGQVYSGERDAFLLALDTNGNVIWLRQFGTPQVDFGRDVTMDESGVYIAGRTTGKLGDAALGMDDAYVRKLSLDGRNLLWTKQWGTPQGDFAQRLTIDATGVYVTGTILAGEKKVGEDVVIAETQEGYVRKLSKDGAVLWEYMVTSPKADELTHCAVDVTGVYCIGQTYGVLSGRANAGGSDGFLLRLTLDGAPQP